MIELSLCDIMFSSVSEIDFSSITKGKYPFSYLWIPLLCLMLATSCICLFQGGCEPQGNDIK